MRLMLRASGHFVSWFLKNSDALFEWVRRYGKYVWRSYKLSFDSAHKGFEPDPAELQPYLRALDSRDNTIAAGFVLAGNHFDVHRYHPPLVYGRRGGPEEGEGIALARATRNGQSVYSIITYEFPILSARAVPQLIEFLRAHVGNVEIPPPN